jgi:hypothetical protein
MNEPTTTSIFEKARAALTAGEAAAAKLSAGLPPEMVKRIHVDTFSKIILSIALSCRRANRNARRARRERGNR